MSTASAAHERDRRHPPGQASDERKAVEPASVQTTRPAEASLVALQQSAGNQAVARAIAGDRPGIQRAPNDEDDAVLSIPPPRSPAPSEGSSRSGSEIPRLSELPSGPPDSVFPLEDEGGEPQFERPGRRTRPAHWDDAHAVPESQAAELYEWNPTAVIRSQTLELHQQRYRLDGGLGRVVPRVFRVGVQIIVGPDFPGPATDLPNIGATGGVGLGRPSGAAGSPGGRPASTGPAASGVRQDPSRDARVPGIPARRPTTWATAEEATDDEVAAAAGSRTVYRSPTDEYHREAYVIDNGQGDVPRAFKVGNIYIVAPNHPAQGAIPLRIPGTSDGGRGSGGPLAGAAARTARPRPAESRPAPSGELGPATTPATNLTAEQLGIVPGSELDTPRGRANRAEQMRRAALHMVDAATLEGREQPDGTRPAGTGIDARARARAADYASTYAEWSTLGPEGRRERVTQIINAHLAREGIPPVRVVFSGRMEPGNAEFAASLWTMSLSGRAVDAGQLSIAEFATLVDNAVHETQHVVTTFRGIRVAMTTQVGYDPRSYIPEHIVERAQAANARRHPDRELDEHARGEALEIYQLSVQPDRARSVNVGAGEASRELVIARRDATTAAYDDARALHAFNEDELRKDPANPELIRNEYESRIAAERAYREHIAAHNDYIALAEETFSWRAGSAVKAAVAERLTMEDELRQARQTEVAAADEERQKRAAGDREGAADALRRRHAAREAARQTQARIAALTSTEAKLVGGRLERRDVPLTDAEITNAPRAPRPGDDDTPPAPAAGGAGAPRPSASARVAPPPGRPVRTDGAATDPSTTETVTRPGVDAAASAAKAAATISPAPYTADGPPRTRRTITSTTGATGVETEWTREQETAVGDVSYKTERGGGFTVGGGDIVGAGVRSTATATVGDVSQAVTTSGKVALGTDMSVGATVGRTRETTHGVDERGEPIKSSTSTTGGVKVGPEGVGGSLGRSTTSKTGTTKSTTAGVNVDRQGNVSVEVGHGISGKSGSGIKTTVSAGTKVEAGEPVEVDGMFEVTYTVTTTTGVGIGGSASRTSAGPSVGVSVGASEAHGKTGVRRFKSKKEAEAFRENAAMAVAMDANAGLPTTAAAALKLPVGETRGSVDTKGRSVGVSASYGATVGWGSQKSSSNQLSVRRVSEQLFHVTSVASREEVGSWSISGGLTNVKGSTEYSAFSVTFGFDLATQEGRDAYDRYLGTGIPPVAGARLVRTEGITSQGEHDKVDLLGLSTQWTGETGEKVTRDEKGVQKEFWGKKGHEAKPGWVASNIFGEEELKSKAQVTSRQEGGRESYSATIEIGGESAAYNREQFNKLLLSTQEARAGAKPSGEWTLTAEISNKVIRYLETETSFFEGARTRDDKMRRLSQTIKEEGAGPLAALVRGGDNWLAWSIELKGDPNFPGVAGRQALNEQRNRLRATLKSDPATAATVVSEADETLKKLEARRGAVADKARYTDLPDELRWQQLALIDKHMNEFKVVRNRAQMETVKRARAERAEGAGTRPGEKGGAPVSAEERETAKVLESLSAKDDAVVATHGQIQQASKAVQKAYGDSDRRQVEVREAYRDHFEKAKQVDERQTALDTKSQELRDAWDKETDAKAKLDKLRALEKAVGERLELLKAQLDHLKQAAIAIRPIATEAGMEGYDAFWVGIPIVGTAY